MTSKFLHGSPASQKNYRGGIDECTEEGSMDNVPTAPHTDKDEFSPVGTLLFVMIMLIGYVVYWGYIWFLVVIERGGN
jgi:hypothetical protein